MSTIHFNKAEIIQSSVEMVCRNTGISIVKRDRLAYVKEHLNNSVILYIHMKA